MDDLSTEITWKKRGGSLWEKICSEPWVSVLIGFLVLLFATFLTVVICDDPQWIYPRLGLETKSGKNEALKFLGIGMGGLLIAIQAVMSYKRAKALEDTVKNTEQGQRQERLKNAIEHLGNDRDSVRLGGAYELFHLARDTPDLRQTVLDILCAHIRQTTRESKYREDYKQNPSEEIQSILTLLFVQEHKVFTRLHINLQGSWLNGSTLYKARLEKANLRGVQLHGANLMDAQLHGAYLARAQLHEADLMNAQLHGAFSNNPRGFDFNESFEAVINERIGEESDLSGVISARGLTQKDLASIGKGLPDEDAKKLREKLKAHIGKPESRDLPESRGAIRGKYTEEEARQWIAEYETALSAVPEIG